METKIIAYINNVGIEVINITERLVPIRPICEALGVNYSTQLEKLKNNPVYNSTIPLRGTVGADGKNREMACLPLRLVSGWIFSIHPDNVKKEIRQKIINYQKECNNVLYDYFYGNAIKRADSFQKTSQLKDEMNGILNKTDKTSEDFNRYLDILKDLKHEKSFRKTLTKEITSQYRIDFKTTNKE